jgi:hypothetical protein
MGTPQRPNRALVKVTRAENDDPEAQMRTVTRDGIQYSRHVAKVLQAAQPYSSRAGKLGDN